MHTSRISSQPETTDDMCAPCCVRLDRLRCRTLMARFLIGLYAIFSDWAGILQAHISAFVSDGCQHVNSMPGGVAVLVTDAEEVDLCAV